MKNKISWKRSEGKQKRKQQERNHALLDPRKYRFFINPKKKFVFHSAHLLQASAFGATRQAAALVRWDHDNDCYYVEDFLSTVDSRKPIKRLEINKSRKAANLVIDKGQGFCREFTVRKYIRPKRLRELSSSGVLMQWDILKIGAQQDFSDTRVLVRHLPTKSVMVPWTNWPNKIPRFRINSEVRPLLDHFISG